MWAILRLWCYLQISYTRCGGGVGDWVGVGGGERDLVVFSSGYHDLGLLPVDYHYFTSRLAMQFNQTAPPPLQNKSNENRSFENLKIYTRLFPFLHNCCWSILSTINSLPETLAPATRRDICRSSCEVIKVLHSPTETLYISLKNHYNLH